MNEFLITNQPRSKWHPKSMDSLSTYKHTVCRHYPCIFKCILPWNRRQVRCTLYIRRVIHKCNVLKPTYAMHVRRYVGWNCNFQFSFNLRHPFNAHCFKNRKITLFRMSIKYWDGEENGSHQEMDGKQPNVITFTQCCSNTILKSNSYVARHVKKEWKLV